ncbi:hypothetical protein SpCBS45565_g04439 [Spizellomyces sp. 'palustris']|nr:hypothetical protein SpCBS45565_g04439 [Spizellomyces sp. 'palustris']
MCYFKSVKALERRTISPSIGISQPLQVHPAQQQHQEQQQQQLHQVQPQQKPGYFDPSFVAEDPFVTSGLYDFAGIYQDRSPATSWTSPIAVTGTYSPFADILQQDIPNQNDFTLYTNNQDSLDDWLASLTTTTNSTSSPEPYSTDVSSTSSLSPRGVPLPENNSPILNDTPVKKEAKRAAEDEDISDPNLRKRMKNTEAARRSRQRKMARLDTLEHQVTNLEGDKSKLLMRVAVLENERSTFQQREQELSARIASLEKQLQESHRAMLQVGMRA